MIVLCHLCCNPHQTTSVAPGNATRLAHCILQPCELPPYPIAGCHQARRGTMRLPRLRAPLSLRRRDNIQNGYIESNNKSAIYERQEEKLLNLPGGPYTGMKRSSAVGTTATKETPKRKTWRKRDDLRGTCATFHFRSCNPDSRGSKVAERAVSKPP